MDPILKYYLRPDIQKALVSIATDREIAVKFGDKGFGKRPDILQYEGDVKAFAEMGATSFHASEERWKDPLQLRPGMLTKELDALRKGFDLVIDVDSKFLDYSKICANLILEALKYHDISNFGVKFSGRAGFHIIVPFETFPKEINGKPIASLFPEGARVVANYLKHLMKDHLKNHLNLFVVVLLCPASRKIWEHS